MTRMHAALEQKWDEFRVDYLTNCAETGQPPTRTVDELWQMFRADFPPKFGLRGNGYVYCKQCKSPFEPHRLTDGKCADCHAILANMIALGMSNNQKRGKPMPASEISEGAFCLVVVVLVLLGLNALGRRDRRK